MASIIDNYRPREAEWKLNRLYDLIDREELIHIEKTFIEVSLFMELYLHLNGLEPTSENGSHILAAIRKLNPTFAQDDNPEYRKEQLKKVIGIYHAHYHAWVAGGLNVPYVLFGFINRIDLSYKNTYLSKALGMNVGNMNNYKFKKLSFDKSIDKLLMFWNEEVETNFDRADIQTRHEIVRLIQTLQDRRGMSEGDYYE